MRIQLNTVQTSGVITHMLRDFKDMGIDLMKIKHSKPKDMVADKPFHRVKLDKPLMPERKGMLSNYSNHEILSYDIELEDDYHLLLEARDRTLVGVSFIVIDGDVCADLEYGEKVEIEGADFFNVKPMFTKLRIDKDGDDYFLSKFHGAANNLEKGFNFQEGQDIYALKEPNRFVANIRELYSPNSIYNLVKCMGLEGKGFDISIIKTAIKENGFIFKSEDIHFYCPIRFNMNIKRPHCIDHEVRLVRDGKVDEYIESLNPNRLNNTVVLRCEMDTTVMLRFMSCDAIWSDRMVMPYSPKLYDIARKMGLKVIIVNIDGDAVEEVKCDSKTMIHRPGPLYLYNEIKTSDSNKPVWGGVKHWRDITDDTVVTDDINVETFTELPETWCTLKDYKKSVSEIDFNILVFPTTVDQKILTIESVTPVNYIVNRSASYKKPGNCPLDLTGPDSLSFKFVESDNLGANDGTHLRISRPGIREPWRLNIETIDERYDYYCTDNPDKKLTLQEYVDRLLMTISNLANFYEIDIHIDCVNSDIAKFVELSTVDTVKSNELTYVVRP
tara:strand:- start:13026 stop:14696 length:1671 start_codon:yes stop_codon:yes gene_type:complete